MCVRLQMDSTIELIQWYSMYISHWSSAIYGIYIWDIIIWDIQSGLAEAKESRCKEIADELVKQITAIGCDENNAHIGRRGFNMLKNHWEWLLYGQYMVIYMVIVWSIYAYYNHSARWINMTCFSLQPESQASDAPERRETNNHSARFGRSYCRIL